MPLAFAEIYCHMVWRIADASARMNLPTRKIVRKFIENSGERFGYRLIAASVLDDHVHILVGLLPGIAPGLLVELVKNEINQYLSRTLAMQNPPCWDDGYGVISVSRAHVDALAHYVGQQEKRHLHGKINATLERVRC